MASGGSVSDLLLPRAVSEWVRSELLFRVDKKSKGSYTWDQFRLVWDPVDNQEGSLMGDCISQPTDFQQCPTNR